MLGWKRMFTALSNATILTPTDVIEQGSVVVSDEGKITYVGPSEEMPSVAEPPHDLSGRIVAPGFIDIHVHGGNGVTFGDLHTLADDLRAYSAWVVSCGVTGFLCTVAAPDVRSLLAVVSEYVQLLEEGLWPGATPLGLHLEGPFLSLEKRGAFNPSWLRDPSLGEMKALIEAGRGWIRQVTLAPELPGAAGIAKLLRDSGIVVALGHSNQDYEGASAALRGDWGHVTHTFNAQSGFHHREPGVLGAVLASDGVTAELIADGVHAHPGAMKVLVRCLGTDRVVLITDAMAGAGLPDGHYSLVGLEVTVKNGRATNADGTIAGSTGTLDLCVRNVNRLVGVPLAEAIRMASLNPARVIGLDGSLGSLEVGQSANLVVLDQDVSADACMVDGRLVYGSF
jgi:N-acetylglucosamine-6-phosphate deacetylase